MTSTPLSPAPSPEDLAGDDVWRKLLALAGENVADTSFIHALLELWCARHGVAEAALYLTVDEGGLRRETVVGSARSFPPILEKPEHGDLTVLELPGGALLYPAAALAPGAAPEEVGPVRLLLAAAARISRLRHQLKRKHFQVSYRGVELEALYDVGLAITSTLDLAQLSEEILLRAVSLLDARQGALYRLEDGAYRLSRAIGGEAAPVVDAGDPRLARLLEEGLRRGPHPLLPAARHLLAVPIELEGKPRGLLVMGDKESRRGIGPFGEGERRTLALFANQAAIALENAQLHRQALEKERMEREMELAAEIQRQILPERLPEVAGFEIYGWSRPARQVGGDYYDARRLEDGHLVATLGDVSGKGVPAALLVSTLHSSLHLLLERHGVSPELFAFLNRHVAESSLPNKFITLILAQVKEGEEQLRYLSAGHNPGLLVRRGGDVEELGACGPPVGLLAGASYRCAAVPFAAGDLLCLYSDGITEAADRGEREFGGDRLARLLRDSRRRPLPEIVDAIEEETTRFAQGQPQADDQTLLLLRRR